MFWIGMIVGIVLFITVFLGYFGWCMHITGTSWDDFVNLVLVNETAIENRESTVQVWHEGDCLLERVFEENE